MGARIAAARTAARLTVDLGSVILRRPGLAAVIIALCWLSSGTVGAVVTVISWGAAGSASVWMLIHPRSFTSVLNEVSLFAEGRSLRRRWKDLLAPCGLVGEEPHGTPLLLRVRTRWPRIVLAARLAPGQTLTDFEQASDRFRCTANAVGCRVEPLAPNEIEIVLTFGDVLAEPETYADAPPLASDASSVRIGRVDDGRPWELPIGPHTLVAGCSGAGKGSVFWSFALGLTPAVRRGEVQLHGIDLKGGMELMMGAPLFASRATDAGSAVDVLEQAVAWMEARTRRLAGHVRSHTPTPDEPRHILLIDELAALTAYCPDRELQRRAERALNLLCSQGRAPGFMVFACLQDPRKEVIPSRGLFTQMVGLRLRDLSEAVMVLGEGPVANGAHPHRIPRSTPGVGYVLPDDGGPALRVRASYVPDDVIRRIADEVGPAVRGITPPADDDPKASSR